MLQKIIFEAVELLQLQWKNQRALSLAVAEMLKARLGVIQVVIGYTDVKTGARQKLLHEEPEDLELFNDFNPSVKRCVAALRLPLQMASGEASLSGLEESWESCSPFEMLLRPTIRGNRLGVLIPIWKCDALVDFFLVFPSDKHDAIQGIEFMNRFLPYFGAACNRIWMQPSDESEQLTLERLLEKGLNQQESKVMIWKMKGKTNSEIGVILRLNLQTVKNYASRAYRKLGVENRSAAFVVLSNMLR
jgi:DNA-binding CsgD family transcriptional regulator